MIDPRRIDLVRTPHVEAAYHLPLAPGTNVAIVNALAHVVVTEGLADEDFVAERCEGSPSGPTSSPVPRTARRRWPSVIGVPAEDIRARGPALRRRPQLGRSTTASA